MTIFHYLCWSKRSRTADIAWVPGDMLSPEDAQGRGVLHLAVERGNLDMIHFLLTRNQEQEQKPGEVQVHPSPIKTSPDHNSRTLLHYATESSRVQTIDLLLDLGFDLHARDNDNRTLMHHAASRGNVNAIKRLIELGAGEQLRAVDNEGRTPAQLARMRRADAVVRFVEDLGNVRFVGSSGEGDENENEGDEVEYGRVWSNWLMLLWGLLNLRVPWFLLGIFVATVVFPRFL
jgi:ankyrin repeat protein